jgi:hypothetical protein
MPHKNKRQQLYMFVIQIIIILCFPALLRFEKFFHFYINQSALESSTGASANNRIISIRKSNPSFIFVGNSMVSTRISIKHLNKLLTNEKAAMLVNGGSNVMHWYLYLKNIIIPSGLKPKKVFIFFRNANITQHRQFSQGLTYIDAIGKQLSTEEDKELAKKMPGQNNFRSKLKKALRETYPIFNAKKNIEKMLNHVATTLVLDADETPDIFMQTVNSTFSEEKQRFDEINRIITIRTSEEHSIKQKLDNLQSKFEGSYLELIIKLSREHNISLCFVRVKTWPNYRGKLQEPQKTQKYINDLALYIKEQGFAFFDFTSNKNITRNMYSDTQHISSAWKNYYTKFFLETLQEEFL